jgi:hypothetical protein
MIALLGGIFILAVIGVVMCWPFFLIKGEEKQRDAFLFVAMPLMCVLVLAILVMAECG